VPEYANLTSEESDWSYEKDEARFFEDLHHVLKIEGEEEECTENPEVLFKSKHENLRLPYQMQESR